MCKGQGQVRLQKDYITLKRVRTIIVKNYKVPVKVQHDNYYRKDKMRGSERGEKNLQNMKDTTRQIGSCTL